MKALIDIFRKVNGVEKIVASVANDNASLKQAVMGLDEVSISVTTESVLDVVVDDYIKINGIEYTLNRDAEFEQRSDVEHSYTFIFEAPLYRLIDKRFAHKITRKTKVVLTGKLRDFLELLIWNANKSTENPLGVDSGWKLGNIVDTDFKTLTFENMTCRDVLGKLATDFNVEYNVVGRTINYVDRIELETKLTFTQGLSGGLYSVTQQNVDSGNVVTRVYPKGGTENVTPGEGDEEGCLILPEGFIENFTESKRVVEDIVSFSDIHPSFLGKTTVVSGENNRDFTCPTIDFNINDIAIGTDARINFMTGDLMGKSFEFAWNNDTKKITLIYQEDSLEVIDPTTKVRPSLPSAGQKLRGGETFTITGVKLGGKYKENAVTKLRNKATEWLAFHARKRISFTLTVDYRYLRKIKHNLQVGELITIKVTKHNIDKLIRITSIEKNLRSGQITCVVSNYLDEKWEKKIEGQISSIQQTVVSGGVGANGADLLEENDMRSASDRLGTSALRTLKEIRDRSISKKEKDVAEKEITFKEGLVSESSAHFKDGLVSDKVESEQFLSGAFGFGMKMWMQNGISYAEIDNLLVRRETVFNKITIAEIKAVGGQILITVADIVCNKVEELSTAYRCYFDNQDDTIINPFVKFDQARCQIFNGKNQKYYWRLVVGVGVDYIDLSKSDCDGTGVPAAGDNIIQLGNRTDIARQSAIHESAYGVDAPFSKHYRGINSYSLVGKATRIESATESVYTGDFRIKSGNKIVPIPADIPYVAGQECTYYQRVSYNGALWLCIVEEGKKTTEVPSDSSQVWIKQVDKGADGLAGKDGKDAGVNLLKWQEEWKEGALPAGWERNGSIEENSLIYGENPFKVRSLMWKCTPDVNGESSGGYHTPPMLLDEKYAHRFSTFVFRVRTGNGGVYHGCYGLDDLNDTENGNPYFWSGDLPALEWFLLVGYIHPKGSVVSKSLSGVYNMKGEKIIEGADYKFRKPNVEIRPRNYLYYSNMPAGEVYFYNPMLHKLDGTEPSIEQMLQLSARKEIDKAKEIAAAQAQAAKDAADAAQTRADSAVTDAKKANDTLSNWASDSYISPTEKVAMRSMQAQVTSDKQALCEQASQYSVDSSALTIAYNSYNAQLTAHTASTPENIPVSSLLASTQAAYNNARIALSTAIAVATKNDAKTKADAAAAAANAVAETVKELKITYDKKWTSTDERFESTITATKTYTDNAANKTKKTIDARSLDPNKFYPITMALVLTPCIITVARDLNGVYGIPPYSTHPGGFSVLAQWTSNGCGWGAMPIYRTIHQYVDGWSNGLVAGSIGQMRESSQEYIYVRGGSMYDVVVDGMTGCDISLREQTYTTYEETIAPLSEVVLPISTINATSAAAEEAAKKYAAAEAERIRIVAEANADGKITKAEARAIADATKKANAAKDAAIGAASSDATKKAEAAREAAEAAGRKYVKEQDYATISHTSDSITLAVGNIQVGGINLVNNSKTNETSSNYGFAVRTVNLSAGEKYTFSARGYRDQTALNEGCYLVCWINLGDWSFGVHVDFEKSPAMVAETKSTTFTAPITGTYSVCSYMYPGDAKARNGKVTAEWYKVERGNKATDWSLSQEELPTIDKIISSINLSKEEATINAERIRLNGNVIANAIQTDGLNVGNKTFIDAVGNFKTDNGTFTGKMNATSGSIGNFSITDGDIIGLDTGKKERVRVSTSPLPAISGLFTGFSLIGNIPAYTADGRLSIDRVSESYYQGGDSRNVRITLDGATSLMITGGQGHAGYSYDRSTYNPNWRLEVKPSKLTLISVTTGGIIVDNVPFDTSIPVNYVGDVYVKCDVSYFLYNVVAEFNPNEEVYENINIPEVGIYKLGTTEKTYIGSDGLYSVFGSGEYIYFKRGVGLVCKGKTDMPGVLAAGSVSAGGTQTNVWGAKSSVNPATKGGVGVFNVQHNIGHTNYTVTANASGADTRYAAILFIISKSAYSVKLGVSGSDGRYYDIGFDYTIVGLN